MDYRLLSLRTFVRRSFWLTILAITCSFSRTQAETASGLISASNYASIQAAIDANPGQPIFVPAGEHFIREKIRLRTDFSGLYGPGRIVQQDSKQPIVEIENARGVELRDVCLTRGEGQQETASEGVLVLQCRDLVIENVRVIDNRTRSAAIALRECQGARISRCLVRNYMRVSIDDRTADANWGYAFHCTDGTGISVNRSTGTLLEGNRVVEERLLPTRDIKAQHQLGDWSQKNAVKGRLVSQKTWDAEYTDNWQQGSAIIVTGPEVSDFTRILGNHIENAAQGIDLHADRVTVANNMVVNSFIGMKAMHGSRNVLITGNQFVKNTLWAIGLMPGVSSHAGNIDGGSIIANNIISDFGHGDAHWIWGSERSPLKFDHGQQADDPPLTDVLIQGNLIHQSGERRYAFAVVVEGEPGAPRGLSFANNLFPPGAQGVSTVPLQP
jgi:hypothetical protein